MKVRSLLFDKRRATISVLIILIVGAGLFTTSITHQSTKVLDAFGICRGFYVKPIHDIPFEVIPAAKKFFHTEYAVGILEYSTEVDPIRESTTPHRCTGVPDNMNPYGLDQVLTDKKQIAALALKQQHYSGVIPPGATKALRISVLHHVTAPKYTGSDRTLMEYLGSSSPYEGSDLIVAFYPKRGWVVVFEFPPQGGFPAYP